MAERQGHLMRHRGGCGHWFVVYSLEPTPELCPDCADKATEKLGASRNALVQVVRDIGRVNLHELCGVEELDEWLDEWGVVDLEIRKDIYVVAELIDDARAALDRAEREGRKRLEKYSARDYPKAERLTIPMGTTGVNTMKLDWKSYGDTGRIAKGNKGIWRIVTDGRWWHLDLNGKSRGRFTDRKDAQSHAQDREDDIEIVAQA